NTRGLGSLGVSAIDANTYARRIHRLTGLDVVVRNGGTTPSVAQSGATAIAASDASGMLRGGAALPAIAPGASANVTLALRALAAPPASLAGSHSIVVELGTLRAAPLTVEIPATRCAPARLATAAKNVSPTVPPATPAAVLATPSLILPGKTLPAAVQIGLPVPVALHYTTNVATCTARGGDAESCATLFRANAVAIYWSAPAGGCGSCQITGYRVRHPAVSFARAGSPPGPVLDQTKTEISVQPMPPGGWTGSCFVVSSYTEPVTTMVNDGTGHKIPLPGATPVGRRDESASSQKLCIGATRRDVSIAPSATRHFLRRDWINYRTDAKEHVDDDPPTSGIPFAIGMHYIKNKEDSQVNSFHRSVLAFEAGALGNATIYGGSFAYDIDRNCARVGTPAPPGWETARWVVPAGSYTWFPDPPNVRTQLVPVNAQLRAWRPGDQKTFVIDSADSAEFVKDGIEEPQFSCEGTASNVRLIVSTGIEQ
ncbi:MAG: hypothetical protein ABR591_12925, partial [Candidatus Velthaea sp.]